MLTRYLMIVAVITMYSSVAQGDIINVDPGDSIQAAIVAAMDGDEIVVAPGTYNEAINFLGKPITLRSADPDNPDVVAATIIDGTGNFHVVQCVSGEGPDTVLNGFTITGGNADGAAPDNIGGGMYNSSSSPTVTNCTFSANTAASGGGGMYNVNSSATVTNCTFSGNTAGPFANGGGMSNGGGIVHVIGCTFSANTAAYSGGGMSNGGGIAYVIDCTFIANTADFGFGGGMHNAGGIAHVVDCTFTGNNSVLAGGGMGNTASSPTVTNCRFEGNTAGLNGGGMHSQESSNPSVTNCTFAANTAEEGGGITTGGPNSTTMVTGCIFWGNSTDEILGNAMVSYSDVQGGFDGTGNINADPIFVDVDGPDDDPSTFDDNDYRLSPGSPCIDAGDNTAVPEGIDTDLDGNPRFIDDPDTPDTGNGDPPIVDMGAYEFQGLPCPWDLNGDGVVNVLDLSELVMSFGPCEGCPADFDDDGFVGVVDLITLLLNFGPCPGTPCIWDVDGDGFVGVSDVHDVLDNLGPCADPEACPWDINGDGVVNGSDVSAVIIHFGPCP